LRKKTKEESSFSEEKEAKDFCNVGTGARGCTESRTKHTKVFCFFSSEKKILS